MRAAVLLLLFSAASPLATAQSLVVSSEAPASVAGARRAEAVAVDFPALARAAETQETVAFEVLGRRVLLQPQRLDRRSQDRYTWSGPLAGGGRGLVTVEGDALVARLVTLHGTILVEPTRDGRHVAVVPGPDGESADDWLPAPPAAPTRGGTDVLFPDELHMALFYTSAVVDSVGPALPALLQATVDTFNDVLANSAVPMHARLVRTHLVTYQESGTMSTDLYNFTYTGDGVMEDVHGIRDAAHADFAALITETGTNSATGCGIAWLMTAPSTTFAESAFSVTKRRCGGLVFSHEIGHNLGLHHDRYVTSGQGVEPYAYGYTNVDSMDVAAGRPGFRTVLAYNTRCQDLGGTCDRIPFYSNPDSLWNGQPMGLAGSEDNGQAAQQTAPVAAHFRAAAAQNTFSAALAGAPSGLRPDCPDPSDLTTCAASAAAVAVRALPVTATAGGRYYVQGDAAFDGVLAIYAGPYDPSAPLAGLVGFAAPDPSAPAQRRLLVGADLAVGETYTILAAGNAPASAGTASLRAWGMAPLTLLPVAGDATPEAATLLLGMPQPNPAAGEALVTLRVPTAQAVEVVVVDALGRTVATLLRGVVEGGRVQTLTVAGLAPGVYTVVARGADATARQRLTLTGR